MIDGVSVIVPTYNSSQTIRSTLEALRAQEFSDPLEILIIDDCSSDQTGKICQSLGFKVAQNPVNLGLAATLNRGILLSHNGIVVTLHADTVPLSKDWLKRLVAPLYAFDVGAACSLQYPPDCKASELTLWEALFWSKLQPHHALNNKADAYRKDVFARVGTFDDVRFRTAGEDEDMALRLRNHGVRIVGSTGEVLHNHRFGDSPKGKTLQKILVKEYSHGRAGGALRRKFLSHRPGAYVYPVPKSPLYDGLARVLLCFGVFVPFMLVASSFHGFRVVTRKIGRGRKLSAYPVLNVLRYWAYALGYANGLVSGKQR